jgi:hypothetical protein
MADVWALESALLIGCYALGAAAAAGARRDTQRPPDASNVVTLHGPPGEHDAAANRRRMRRARRGKASRVDADPANDALLPFQQRQVPGAAGASAGYEEDFGDDDCARTYSAGSFTTTHSDLSSNNRFGSCLSNQDVFGSRASSVFASPTNAALPQPAAAAAPTTPCPVDLECTRLNDASHFSRFLHTCRLVYCPSAHESSHTRYFVHPNAAGGSQAINATPSSNAAGSSRLGDLSPTCMSPLELHPVATAPASPAASISSASSPRRGRGGRSSQPYGGSPRPTTPGSLGSGLGATAPMRTMVNVTASAWGVSDDGLSDASAGGAQQQQYQQRVHADLSPNAPRAKPLAVEWRPNGHDGATAQMMVWGDWAKVRVHTLKQYLRQATGIPSSDQLLTATVPSAPLPPGHPAPQMQPSLPTAATPPSPVMGRGRGHASMQQRFAAPATSTPPSAPPPTLDKRHVIILVDDTLTVVDAVRPLLRQANQAGADGAVSTPDSTYVASNGTVRVSDVVITVSSTA